MEQPSSSAATAATVWDRPRFVLLLFAPIALLGGLFDSFTKSALALVVVVGAAMFWVGLGGRAGRRPILASLPKAAAWWLIPVLLLASIELVTFSKNNEHDYPTLSLLSDPVLTHYPLKVAAYYGWLVGFWGLIRR